MGHDWERPVLEGGSPLFRDTGRLTLQHEVVVSHETVRRRRPPRFGQASADGLRRLGAELARHTFNPAHPQHM
ncbi:hypothetical protein GCM10018781_79940 [Kitasatospora indigofera]|uniref:Uncharacterized protein n=1 Tax=Kitasatospora indigofera TaxID=67307 RepID=A0A918YWN9_9ACTN|nr:hypothetical protein GCM10018781_79940 [Kitasatospora indigofera]